MSNGADFCFPSEEDLHERAKASVILNCRVYIV